MDYRVSSDADTIVNLTNHSYFNLDGGGDVLNQKLRIYASRYLEGIRPTKILISSTSYSALAVTCGAVISLEMEIILLMRVVVDISSNLAMPLIPTPSLIYSEIVRFNSGI